MHTEATSNVEIFVDRDMVEPELHDVAGGTAVVQSKPSPDKSKQGANERKNEDGALIISLGASRGVLAVADGLGGQPEGGRAAGMALRAISKAVETTNAAPDDLRERILNGFEIANRAIRDMEIGAGTTLAVAEIDHRHIRTYHVGDSMILVVGQRGKLKLQTVPHSPIGYAVEAGLLQEDEAMHHEDRHLVSNIVGSSKMRIEIGPVLELRPRDTLLLASDGLFDNLRIEEIVALIRKGELLGAFRNLIGASEHRMRKSEGGAPSKPDDLTTVAFRLSGQQG